MAPWQTQSSAHNAGTVTTRGGRGGAAAVAVGCPRRRLPEGRRVRSAARAQRERSASAARAQRERIAPAHKHANTQQPAASRARQKSKLSRVRVSRRGRAAQPDAPRPSRSPTRRDSTPRRRAPHAAAADAKEAECRRSKSSRRSMEQQQNIVSRDGAAGGFKPAPLNRRCLPETTSPPREAGASRSGERLQ